MTAATNHMKASRFILNVRNGAMRPPEGASVRLGFLITRQRHNARRATLGLGPDFRNASWPCKNAKTLNRDRRSHSSRTALVARLESEFSLAIELKKIILLVLRFFEFLHSEGHFRTSARMPV